jgi:hypothetical protein
MLAEISSGNADTADVFFLIATIFGFLAALLYITAAIPRHLDARPLHVAVWAPVAGWIGFGFLALAWLVL